MGALPTSHPSLHQILTNDSYCHRQPGMASRAQASPASTVTRPSPTWRWWTTTAWASSQATLSPRISSRRSRSANECLLMRYIGQKIEQIKPCALDHTSRKYGRGRTDKNSFVIYIVIYSVLKTKLGSKV